MRKLFISTMALIIGLVFSAGAFAEMKESTAAPAEKQPTQMGQSEPSHESKAVETKSASTPKKKMKKEGKNKKAKKEAAPAN